MTIQFDRPKKVSIDDQIAAHRRRMAALRREEKKRLGDPSTGVTRRVRRKREFTKDHKCETCIAEGVDQADRLTFGRDPLARLKGETVWVCERHYRRSYRAIRRDPALLVQYERLIG